MPAFARRGDFWSGLALAALGTYIMVQARGWIYLGEDGPGPGFFPMWYGGAMVVLSLFLAAGAVVKPVGGKGAPSWGELRRAMLCWGAFVASIALMNVIGFAGAFALLTWFVIAVMGRQPQRIAIPVAIAGAAIFYSVFEFALDVALPRGLLF